MSRQEGDSLSLIVRPLSCTLLAFALTGCATISGIDQFKEEPCPGGCDGSLPDGTNPPDGSLDAPKDSPSGNDGGPTTDASKDTGTDTGSAGDSGCGATNTVQNCGACGVSCATNNIQSAACSGSTCLYTCNSGYSDCNGTQSPNTDGCECNTPGCCSGSCQTTHSNGEGQSFYDCVTTGTYNQTQATEACAAYTGNQALCTAYSCTGPGSNSVVCGTTGSVCICWNFSGSNVGHAHSSGSSACACPASNDVTWN